MAINSSLAILTISIGNSIHESAIWEEKKLQKIARGKAECYLNCCKCNFSQNCTLMHRIGERASETLSGVTNGNRRYIYIYIYMVRARYFSSAGLVLRNVGGVKCQPFLKRSNYW